MKIFFSISFFVVGKKWTGNFHMNLNSLTDSEAYIPIHFPAKKSHPFFFLIGMMGHPAYIKNQEELTLQPP